MRLRWISLLVTLLILYVAATRLDFSALFRAFTHMNLSWAGFALVIWLAVITCKAWKWKSVVAALNGNIRTRDSLKMLLIGLFVGVITPGRVGDFVRAAYVKDTIGFGKGIMGVFLDRAMDVLTLLLFATLGILGLASAKGIELVSPVTLGIIFLAFGIALALVFNRSLAKRIVWPLVTHVFPHRWSGHLSKYGKEFYDSIPLLKKNAGLLIGAFLLGLISWLFTITFGFFLMRAVGILLGWEVALLTVPILALVEIIPLGIGGAGTRELASVVALSAYGVSAELAVVFSLVYFAFGYIPSFLLGALAFNRTRFPMEGGLKGLLAKMKES